MQAVLPCSELRLTTECCGCCPCRQRPSLQYQHAILTSLAEGRPGDDNEVSPSPTIPPLYVAAPTTPPSPTSSADSQESSPAIFAVWIFHASGRLSCASRVPSA